MAQYEGDTRALLDDKRKVIVGGKRYWFKTTENCKACSQPDRNLYVKQKLGEDWMLECPVCETVTPVKSAMVTEAK